MTVANYLTFFRIFISPIFLLVYLEHQVLGISPVLLPYILLCLLGISELSDLLDGILARRYNQVTDLGKLLDPMADSISRISVFLTFTLPPVHLPMLLIFAFLYRDSVISTLRTVCALKGFALAARPSGKRKAVLQGIAALIVVLAMIPHSLGYLSTESLSYIATVSVGIAGIYALYSGAEYLYANRTYVLRLLTSSSKVCTNHEAGKAL